MSEHAHPAPPVAPIIEVAGEKYMRNSKGALVPVDMIYPAASLEDELVRKIVGYAQPLAAEIARFKGHTFDDVDNYLDLLAQEHGAKRGGLKGNVTFYSFDGCMRVQVAVSDHYDFGPALHDAKSLIDECLGDWASESGPELRVVVQEAFDTEKEGKVNAAQLYRLLTYNITDERWLRAMKIIRDSRRVIGSKRYVRIYRRENAKAKWEGVPIDVAAS